MPLKKDLGQWISHFGKSDAPQFKGKSEEERKNMALAAFRAKYGSLNEAYTSATNNELAQYIAALKDELAYYKQKEDTKRIEMTKKDLADVKAELESRRAKKTTMNEAAEEDAVDTITMDIPLFLRMLEFAREDASEDMDLHDVTEKANLLTKDRGILSMKDYNEVVGAAKDVPKGEIKEMDYGSVLMRNLMPGADDLEQYVNILIMDPKIASSSTEQEFRSLLRDKVEKANFLGSKDKISQAAERILAFGNNADRYSNTITRVFNMLKGKSVKEAFSKEYDDDPALKGGQKKLPDALQKSIISKAKKKMEEASDSPAEQAAQAAEEKALLLRRKAIDDKLATIKKGGLTEGREFDYEGSMARTQLFSIIKNSKSLFDQIDDRTQLQGWVQSKLTKAEDYIDAVRTYLEGESLSTTTPLVVSEEMMKDEEGASLNIGDVVKAGDGGIYQVIFSYMEGKPFLVPFDLKKRKPTNLRNRIYFDSDSMIVRKLHKVMPFSATKGGFMK
jgi:hypothetical protein